MRCGVVLLVLLASCSYGESGRGEDCTRSSQCARGLVCIEEACTDSLDGIEDPGTVPMLQSDAGAEEDEDDAG